MALGYVCNDSVMTNKAKGFYNHSANTITTEKLIYCIWEVKEGISTEEFQKFINVPLGQLIAIEALMNIWKLLDISLIDGQTPYPRVFL